MEEKTNGYIYILTNPSFPDYVKIGYADNVKNRLAQLNRSECTPFAFRVYATYQVSNRLTDMKLHDMIDKLNPELRSVETIDGKKRVREFYAISAEDAYEIFEAMAEIHGTTTRLLKIKPNKKEKVEEKIAEECRKRSKPFTFSMVNIPVGDEVEFSCRGNQYDGFLCKVVDDRHIEYNGKTYSLSALAKELSGRINQVAGPQYFKYKGSWLNDLRHNM